MRIFKNYKRIFIAITVTLIVYAIIFAFIAETIDNISLNPGDYGDADFLTKQYAMKYVSRRTGIDVMDGELYYGFDDHGGFHGDGITYIEIRMPVSIDTEISEDCEWRRFPAPETIELNVCKSGIDKHSGDYEELLPEINNGWYYFKDRTPDYADNILNFTIAAYDSDSKVFYFCNYDL